MNECIFCRIIKGEMKTNKVWEDERVLAIRDIKPVADTHILLIPKKHIEDFSMLEDDKILSSIRRGVQELVGKNELMGKGYKIQVNGGGAQIIPHLHFHLVGPIGKAVEM